MNCQSCRQHLNLFLDDELDVRENVQVLEHLNACASCGALFQAERRIWESVGGRFRGLVCPTRSRDRYLAAMRKERRAGLWRVLGFRVGPALLAAASLLIVARVALRQETATGDEGGAAAGARHAALDPTDRKLPDHPLGIHGEFLDWASARYTELSGGLPRDQVLTPAAIEAASTAVRPMLSLDAFTVAASEKLKVPVVIPASFLAGGTVLGCGIVEFEELPVAEIIVSFGDREVVVFQIGHCEAELFLTAMPKVAEDLARGYRIERCIGCDALVVHAGKKVFVVVSRQSRDWNDDWIVARARRLVD